MDDCAEIIITVHWPNETPLRIYSFSVKNKEEYQTLLTRLEVLANLKNTMEHHGITTAEALKTHFADEAAELERQILVNNMKTAIELGLEGG